eukprot:14385911-Alexandrium_andersonii.AAC.1
MRHAPRQLVGVPGVGLASQALGSPPNDAPQQANLLEIGRPSSEAPLRFAEKGLLYCLSRLAQVGVVP